MADRVSRWRLERTEIALSTPWMTIHRKLYTRGLSGSLEPYYVVERSDFVLVVAFVDDQLLLVRQYRPGTDKYYWSLPAGYIENGETADTAAERELKEETGYYGKNFALVGELDPLPGYVLSKACIVTCSARAGERNRDSEVDEIRRVSWTQALKMIKLGGIHEMQAVAAILLVNQLITATR